MLGLRSPRNLVGQRRRRGKNKKREQTHRMDASASGGMTSQSPPGAIIYQSLSTRAARAAQLRAACQFFCRSTLNIHLAFHSAVSADSKQLRPSSSTLIRAAAAVILRAQLPSQAKQTNKRGRMIRPTSLRHLAGRPHQTLTATGLSAAGGRLSVE